ncbi:hypothetical protein [Clostridium paraputrificum]|uniref:Uncharacterized protein n=1 Tax=Clostridium paraputrificum TaxID=29363 RepID=A0A6N3EV87_9CLOT
MVIYTLVAAILLISAIVLVTVGSRNEGKENLMFIGFILAGLWLLWCLSPIMNLTDKL